MNDNIRDCVSSVHAQKFPHHPNLWPYNWFPRITDPWLRFPWNSSFAWRNRLPHYKYPLELVIPGPDSTPYNHLFITIEETLPANDFTSGNPTPPETT